MFIEIPDRIVRYAETNATELLVLLAIQLYADNRIDHAEACSLAGISPAMLNWELLSRQISVQEYPHRQREAG